MNLMLLLREFERTPKSLTAILPEDVARSPKRQE
jgi:hypothetical protein